MITGNLKVIPDARVRNIISKGPKYIVYVEWASRVNFVTIFGDLYQNKLWVISNILNQFAHLSSASGPSNDVIKMAVIVLLMYTYKTSYLKK